MARSRKYLFELQFPSSDILSYSKRYKFQGDLAARETGQRIYAGDCSRANLLTIFEWKTKGRGRSRPNANSDEDIAEALKLACLATTARAAISVLCGLEGVNIPVASAILTAVKTNIYTIIDFRATEALGQRSNSPSMDFYLQYLAACKDLSVKNNISLRELDRALWQWSLENK